MPVTSVLFPKLYHLTSKKRVKKITFLAFKNQGSCLKKCFPAVHNTGFRPR